MDIIAAGGFELDGDRLVNAETGEIIEDPVHVVVPSGTRMSTPDDRERNRIAMETRLAHERYCRRDGETYFFVRRDTCFAGVPPATVTKLLYLCSYANFDNNVLMLSQRTKMKRKDLADVLRISSGGAFNFWSAVTPEYVMKDENESLTIDRRWFRRGRLPRNAFTPFHQMYDDGIRKLYEAMDGRYLKQLGYLFKLLPYISAEYNLLCHNPEEKDREKIQLVSISEFCAAIGYDRHNIDKLAKVYDDIRFDANGRQERFCTLIYTGLETCDAIICINPSIMYSGSNQNRAEITQLYFND